MKTRIFPFLLALLFVMLTSVAAAQDYYTFPEVREQAAAGWHQTYEAYGRQIVIDVDPEIPDVEQVPIEKLVAVKREAPAAGEENGLIFDCVRPEDNLFGFCTPASAEELPKNIDSRPENGTALPRDWDRVYTLGSTLTLAGAIDVVRDGLTRAGLDAAEWDLEHPYQLRTFSYKDTKSKEIVLPGAYYMFFHQVINGIPLLNNAGDVFYHMAGGAIASRMSVWLSDQDSYDIKAMIFKSEGRMAEDVPLCSFEKVKEAFETEIQAGHIRKVYGLEFGYLYYEDTEDQYERYPGYYWTDHFYAVPAWQLTCLYMYDRNKELPNYGDEDEAPNELAGLEYAMITVDAQTGELRDWMSEAKGRENFKGFISWNDVW